MGMQGALYVKRSPIRINLVSPGVQEKGRTRVPNTHPWREFLYEMKEEQVVRDCVAE